MQLVARHRYVLVVALVLASIGVTGLVVRLNRDPAPGKPLMVSPALPSVAESPPPPAVVVGAAPPSTLRKSPVASKSPSKSASPSRTPSRSPSARPTRTTPPAASSIYARYSVQRGRGDDVRGFGAVQNTGNGAGSWTMTLTFESGVDITGASGATLSSGGNVAVFRGGSLGPDRTTMFSFRGDVGRGASIRPLSCSINGKSCSGGGRR